MKMILFLAFKDLYPDAQVHLLIIPKGKYSNYADFVNNATCEQISHFFKIVSKIAIMSGIEEDFRTVVNSGKFQHVPHFHLHLMGGEFFVETSKKNFQKSRDINVK